MTPTAVLLSSGLDSAVLAATEARTRGVHPIYISTGLAWEHDKLAALDRHWGQCSKCRERRNRFNGAGVEDRTRYAAAPRR